jgi:hypothetical protein
MSGAKQTTFGPPPKTPAYVLFYRSFFAVKNLILSLSPVFLFGLMAQRGNGTKGKGEPRRGVSPMVKGQQMALAIWKR